MNVCAASFNDINAPAVFLKQTPGDKKCTLFSATIMIRRAAFLSGDADWKSITAGKVEPYAWKKNTGLLFSFSYGRYNVRHAYLPGGKQNREFLISLLKEHPEGVEIYDINTPHAVLLTDCTDGEFYCGDPANGTPTGRIHISKAYGVTIENADAYWYVLSPECFLDGVAKPVQSPNPTYTPDPAKYKVSYSRILFVSGSQMTGNDVKYVQACLHYLGYDVEITGRYDNATALAIRRFQSDSGLSADGKCGPATWAALEKAISNAPAPLSVSVSADKTVLYSDELVTLTAKAGKSASAYQWYFRKSGKTEWTLWSNHATAVTSSMTGDGWNGIQFFCRVTDKSGNRVDSDKLTLSLIPRPRIVAQPSNVTAKENCAAAFVVMAEGKGLQYQWYYKKQGAGAWSVWNGHDTAVTSAPINSSWDGMKVYCRVTDMRGTSVDSNAASVAVIPNLVITSQPANITAALGSTLNVSLKASGSGLSYQWYFKKKGESGFSVWNGRTGASETVTPNETWNGIQLCCVVKDSYGDSLRSNVVTVTLTTPKITVQPVSRTVISGESLTVSLRATGTGLRYQWYFKKKGTSSFAVWNGRTGASETVIPNDSWDGIQLYCLVRDSAGNTVKSDVVTVKVTGQPTAKG